MVYDRNIFASSSVVFGNLRKIFGNVCKMSGNVRLAYGTILENIRKSLEGHRKSSENRQKRRHQHVHIIKSTLHVSSKIWILCSRGKNYISNIKFISSHHRVISSMYFPHSSQWDACQLQYNRITINRGHKQNQYVHCMAYLSLHTWWCFGCFASLFDIYFSHRHTTWLKTKTIYNERIHSHIQQPCKFIRTKETVYIRKEFNSNRLGVHQHGYRFIVCIDVICIYSITRFSFAWKTTSLQKEKIK